MATTDIILSALVVVKRPTKFTYQSITAEHLATGNILSYAELATTLLTENKRNGTNVIINIEGIGFLWMPAGLLLRVKIEPINNCRKYQNCLKKARN